MLGICVLAVFQKFIFYWNYFFLLKKCSLVDVEDFCINMWLKCAAFVGSWVIIGLMVVIKTKNGYILCFLQETFWFMICI